MTQTVACEEGRQLKEQYESALKGWERYGFLPRTLASKHEAARRRRSLEHEMSIGE
jgi:hypothetical protein